MEKLKNKSTVLGDHKVTILAPIWCSSKVKVPWKKRIFSWPWNPFKSHIVKKELKELLIDGQVLNVDGQLMMNQATYIKIAKILEKEYE